MIQASRPVKLKTAATAAAAALMGGYKCPSTKSIPTKDKLFNLGEFSLRRPGNMITAVILVVGFVLTFIRFTQGIGSITNLSDTMPWGMWIGFDLLCGVCLAAAGYFTTVACYVMGMKHFHSAVRPAVTTAFLGYAFVVFALLYDLGHPLRLPYMFFFPGTTSVLFEVGLCVATYLTVQVVHRILGGSHGMAVLQVPSRSGARSWCAAPSS